MIGKSLANDFQYTNLKYKKYLYSSLNALCFLFMFISNQFIYQSLFVFCFLKPVPSLNLIHFDLLYYQDNNTEHHKVIYPPCSRNCQILQKKTGNKINKNIAIPYN